MNKKVVGFSRKNVRLVLINYKIQCETMLIRQTKGKQEEELDKEMDEGDRWR